MITVLANKHIIQLSIKKISCNNAMLIRKKLIEKLCKFLSPSQHIETKVLWPNVT